MLLKPLPYASPDSLVMIWSDNTRESRPEYPMSPANFLDYKASATTIDQVEAMFSFVTPASMRTDAGTEQVTTPSRRRACSRCSDDPPPRTRARPVRRQRRGRY